MYEQHEGSSHFLVVIWTTPLSLPWIHLSHGAYILPANIYGEGTLHSCEQCSDPTSKSSLKLPLVTSCFLLFNKYSLHF